MARLAGGLVDIADFPEPTDWTDAGLSAGSGQTLQNVQYKIDGSREVHWTGEIYGPAPAENDVLLTFPEEIEPPFRFVDEILGLAGAAGVFVGVWGSTGSLTEIRFRYLITGAWPSSGVTGMSLHGLKWSLD